MRDMLRATKGKVFTLATLDRLVQHTAISDYLPTYTHDAGHEFVHH